jgi:hypothetical protein
MRHSSFDPGLPLDGVAEGKVQSPRRLGSGICDKYWPKAAVKV